MAGERRGRIGEVDAADGGHGLVGIGEQILRMRGRVRENDQSGGGQSGEKKRSFYIHKNTRTLKLREYKCVFCTWKSEFFLSARRVNQIARLDATKIALYHKGHKSGLFLQNF